ncbi:hypothetical protein [Chondromyces apiculatus]|nr:hypothetical protein [Chondromyces apiculatus]
MSGSEKTYEMFWDCKYCGQKKLLGLTHRFCANCGAPQDATARYFPSDAEKVAVQDHQYVGADLRCPACSAWNSRNVNCCTQCGGPMAAGKVAQVRADQVRAQGQQFGTENLQDAQRAHAQGFMPAHGAPPKPQTSSALKIILALLVVLGVGALGLVCTCIFWTKPAAFQVSGHSWERTVEIESFGPARKSDWCSDMPAGARELSRRKDQRSSKKVADGEDCQTRRKDQGDGTFKETRECKPRYREEPVYAERCEYEINVWSTKGMAKASGSSLNEAPAWPRVDLKRPGTCVGCDREGKRTEKYEVKLVDIKTSKEQRCAFDQPKWSSYAVGSRWSGSIGVLSDSIECSSLKAQ